eukprot:TRINITY_DN17457_c0_g1_i2.p2 TRINITY_DN17457_c0_g1~~TRINITY_DN17457_c0_g1_i2.p2  ORF type:complete len:120 (-),score=5.65 TRINITY_DN17457_c0_g1_i2:249-608(-)
MVLGMLQSDRSSSCPTCWIGSIDDLRIYDQAMNQSELERTITGGCLSDHDCGTDHVCDMGREKCVLRTSVPCEFVCPEGARPDTRCTQCVVIRGSSDSVGLNLFISQFCWTHRIQLSVR